MSRYSNYEMTAGYDLADVAQELNFENDTKIKEVDPDFSEMPFVECITTKGESYMYAISQNGFLQLGENFFQINAATPVGQFIINNWSNLKPGDIITPNGYEITKVGKLTLPSDFVPYKQ